MDKIKNGDVVQLKSGGPKMTVEDAEDQTRISVTWFPVVGFGAAVSTADMYAAEYQTGIFDACGLKVVESA